MDMLGIVRKYWLVLLAFLFVALLAFFAWLALNGNAVDKIPSRGVFIVR